MIEMRRKQVQAGRATIGAAWLVTLAVLAAGCVKKTSDVSGPDFNSKMSKLEADPDARLRELQRESVDYVKLVHMLPADNPLDDRDRIRQAFNTLTQLLPLVHVGPHGGVFDHQVSVVADTRTLLAGGSTDLSAAPIIDRGLRAVYNALDDAQHAGSVYYEDAALKASLDQLSAKINEFDTARGALHDMAWADAFNLTGDVVSRMTAILADRLTEGATTVPATGQSETEPSTTTPTVAPTTGPAEPGAMPATAPTSAPSP